MHGFQLKIAGMTVFSILGVCNPGVIPEVPDPGSRRGVCCLRWQVSYKRTTLAEIRRKSRGGPRSYLPSLQPRRVRPIRLDEDEGRKKLGALKSC